MMRSLVLTTLFCAGTLYGDDGTVVEGMRNDDRMVEGEEAMRYFLIQRDGKVRPPRAGHPLMVVLPGGTGEAVFNPFVQRVAKFTMPEEMVVVQLVAPPLERGQVTVWPTEGNPVGDGKFKTEDFFKAVVDDVAKRGVKIDRDRIFTLSWSSGGPAAYAIALDEKAGVAGSYVAMSVFRPEWMPPLSGAKGKAFFIDHSPEDVVCRFSHAEAAIEELGKEGAEMKLETYAGGHGWKGDVFGRIRGGVEWLLEQTK